MNQAVRALLKEIEEMKYHSQWGHMIVDVIELQDQIEAVEAELLKE